MKRKTADNEIIFTCRQCAFSYDFYGKNYKGEPFMCKCQKSKFSKLLSEKQCKEFSPIKRNINEKINKKHNAF